MDINLQQELTRELGSGEKLLWSGQPAAGIRFVPADLMMIPFSLLWGGFALFWEYTVLKSGTASWFFALWGIPFVLMGVYMIIGRFFFDAHRRARTAYGLTPERVIIISGVFSRETRSLPLKQLPEIAVSERSDGTGTIVFGTQSPLAPTWMGSWPGSARFKPAQFESIPRAREVFGRLRDAQKSLPGS